MDPIPKEDIEIPLSRHFFAKLISGDFGLPTTYWFYGVFGSLLTKFGFTLLGLSHATTAIFAFALVTEAYFIMVWIGIWRAADQYTGDGIWVVAAKIMVAFAVAFNVWSIFHALA